MNNEETRVMPTSSFINQSEKTGEFFTAFIKAQSVMGGAVKDAKNPFFKSNYADLTSVIKAIKEPFASNDLGYMQFPIGKDGHIGIYTKIFHKSDQWVESEFTIPLTKVDPQAVGSVLTYFRRYALQAMVGIPSVDDDAQFFMQTPDTDKKPVVRMTKKKMATVTQLKQLKELLVKKKVELDTYFEGYKITGEDQITFDMADKSIKKMALTSKNSHL
tara:strand:- start:35 stop:685 length:651 start_codon:yes stop_codon:yes gene_type:complete